MSQASSVHNNGSKAFIVKRCENPRKIGVTRTANAANSIAHRRPPSFWVKSAIYATRAKPLVRRLRNGLEGKTTAALVRAILLVGSSCDDQFSFTSGSG